MVTLIVVVVVLVFFGELIFRGILVNRLGVKWGIRTGIIVPALLLGVLAAVFPGGLDAVGATAFGLVAAVLYCAPER